MSRWKSRNNGTHHRTPDLYHLSMWELDRNTQNRSFLWYPISDDPLRRWKICIFSWLTLSCSIVFSPYDWFWTDTYSNSIPYEGYGWHFKNPHSWLWDRYPRDSPLWLWRRCTRYRLEQEYKNPRNTLYKRAWIRITDIRHILISMKSMIWILYF